MTPKIRFLLTSLTACFCTGIIVGAFWFQDWQYSLPTPRPPTLRQPSVGTRLALPAGLASHWIPQDERPLYLHFFSLDCPCSRFNLDHVRELVAKYGKTVRTIVVLQTEDAPASLRGFQKLNLPVEVVADEGGTIAAAYGVYSTPQAVLLDSEGRLYYRGNYNIARYCADPKTEFVRLALDALTAGKPVPSFPAAASRAYGCALPANLPRTVH